MMRNNSEAYMLPTMAVASPCQLLDWGSEELLVELLALAFHVASQRLVLLL